MKNILAILAISVSIFASAQKSKLEQDKDAIRQLEGCFKVTFAFSETFSPDTAYQYHDKKFEWAIEYVKLIEETDKKMVFQHFLIVNDTMIIKHWRQDWVYENQDLLVYERDGNWKNITISKDLAKGTWTQKVFQVDDSPRYEGYGTWVHVDGRHFWEGQADAPLPRREHSKRSDYNVMDRMSHMEIFEDGWVLEQDNNKILRTDAGDKLLCAEKGIERFYTGDYNCDAAIKWWNENEDFWKIVREVWTDKLKSGKVHVQVKLNNQLLFMRLFELGDQVNESGEKLNAKKVREQIIAIVDEHTKVQ